MNKQVAYRPVPARTSAQTATRTYTDHSAVVQTDEGEEFPSGPLVKSSAIRYTDTKGNQIIRQGNRKVVIHKEAPPSRRFHWMLFMGMVMFVMVLGWLVFTAFGYWLQQQQDNWKYGTPRTFQVDQFIGHGDTPDHPDHFIALNTGGMIEVVELNVINPKYDHVYPITTAIDPQTPVFLSFEDTRHTGKLDMLVTIGDSNSYTVILLNNGTQFTK